MSITCFEIVCCTSGDEPGYEKFANKSYKRLFDGLTPKRGKNANTGPQQLPGDARLSSGQLQTFPQSEAVYYMWTKVRLCFRSTELDIVVHAGADLELFSVVPMWRVDT